MAMARETKFSNDVNPSIIMATSGMLEGGPSVEYFKEIAPYEKNKIIRSFLTRLMELWKTCF